MIYQKQKTDLLHYKRLEIKCNIKKQKAIKKKNITTLSSNGSMQQTKLQNTPIHKQFFQKTITPFGNKEQYVMTPKQQANVRSSYKHSKSHQDESGRQIITQLICKTQIDSLSNIKTSKVLCCPFASRQSKLPTGTLNIKNSTTGKIANEIGDMVILCCECECFIYRQQQC